VLSKADLVSPEVAEAARLDWLGRLNDDTPREEWDVADPDEEVPVLVTSSATGAGLDELRTLLLQRVPLAVAGERGPAGPELAREDELPDHRTFRPRAKRAFAVERIDEKVFRVSGAPVERLIARHHLDNEDALAHVEGRLHRMGVIRALEEAGFEAGDDVEIGGIVFELDPG